VVGVQGEDDVQHPRDLGRRRLPVEQRQEPGGVRAGRGRRDRLPPGAHAMPGRDQGGDERHEPERLAEIRLGIARRGVGIQRGGEGHRRPQGVERVGVTRQRPQQRDDRRR
jgi:hypothetical protein